MAIEEDALEYNEILRMNSAGAFILEQLQNGISYSDLTKRMLQRYDADKSTVEKILLDFLDMLVGKELLVDDKGNLVENITVQEA